MLGAEGDRAAQVRGCIDMSTISFYHHIRVRRRELQHYPRQLAVSNKQVRAAANEPMRNVIGVEELQQVWNTLVLRDAEKVGCSADAERSRFRQLCRGLELDAEFGQTFQQPGVVNAHAVPDARLREG